MAALTGAFTGPASTILPNLKFNRESETDEGVFVPVGTYMVTQDGVNVYAKTAFFRVFINTFQYMQYDEKTQKYPNKSIIIKTFNEDAIDELGGIRCGKINRKELETLKAKGLISPQDLEKQEQVRCYRGLYGLVTLQDAVTEAGEDVVVENLPVLWKTQGSNFNAADDALKAITKMKHLYFQHWLVLGKLKREKHGSNVYYTTIAEPILDKEVEFTAEDMVTFKMFQETIDKENRAVAAKWRETKKQAEPYNLEADVLQELALNDGISDIGA